jgi:hypothetical protein
MWLMQKDQGRNENGESGINGQCANPFFCLEFIGIFASMNLYSKGYSGLYFLKYLGFCRLEETEFLSLSLKWITLNHPFAPR